MNKFARDIAGSIALVSGSNRGVGLAVATALAERGAERVYLGARDPALIPDAARRNPRMEPVRLDITDPASVARAAEHCTGTSLLVNSAAIARFGEPVASPSLEDARAQMETNYFGTLQMCRAFAPVLAANGGGAIVNMLSIVSFFAAPGMGTFCATKAAAWSLTHALRGELRRQGTLVVGVHSGFIDTRLAEGTDEPKHPPAEVAAAILDGVEAGSEELLLDERTRQVKNSLPDDLQSIYPMLRGESDT